MSQGIGVRYTASGIRVLGLEQLDKGLNITGIAAGSPGESLESFITEHGFPLDDSVIVCGLCPGDFLLAFMVHEDGMDDVEMEKHLHWEIERKMISNPSEYIIDFATAGTTGFVFAGRRKLVTEMKGSLGNVVTDVEPVALYNGCESVGETGEGLVLLLSIEAEGISSVLLQEGSILAMESFPVREDALTSVLAGLDSDAMKQIDSSATERLSEYVIESINRLTSYLEDESKTAPDRTIITGGGVYVGELAGTVEQKTGIPITVSNPFASLTDEIRVLHPELAEMSAAFTTCFGLAARALEE